MQWPSSSIAAGNNFAENRAEAALEIPIGNESKQKGTPSLLLLGDIAKPPWQLQDVHTQVTLGKQHAAKPSASKFRLPQD